MADQPASRAALRVGVIGAGRVGAVLAAKFRAVGQGYATGLAGIARDFGVQIA